MRRTPLAVALLFGLTAPALAQMGPPGGMQPMPPGQMPMQPVPPGVNPETGARPGNVIGTGMSLPTSNRASNIDSGDTRSVIAPRLPSPDVGQNAGPRAQLMAARQALAAGQTGAAQEALERAETRLLDRSVVPSRANLPDRTPLVTMVGQARRTLATGDRNTTMQMIDQILARMGGPG